MTRKYVKLLISLDVVLFIFRLFLEKIQFKYSLALLHIKQWLTYYYSLVNSTVNVP